MTGANKDAHHASCKQPSAICSNKTLRTKHLWPADIWGFPMKVTIHSDAKNIVASSEVVPQLPPHWLHVALTLTFDWLQPIELLLVCCHLPWQKYKDFSRHYPSGRIPVKYSTWFSLSRTVRCLWIYSISLVDLSSICYKSTCH